LDIAARQKRVERRRWRNSAAGTRKGPVTGRLVPKGRGNDEGATKEGKATQMNSPEKTTRPSLRKKKNFETGRTSGVHKGESKPRTKNSKDGRLKVAEELSRCEIRTTQQSPKSPRGMTPVPSALGAGQFKEVGKKRRDREKIAGRCGK